MWIPLCRALSAALIVTTAVGATLAPAMAATPLKVQALLSPGVIPYDSFAVLAAKTTPGAKCVAKVVYANGAAAPAFAKNAQKALTAPKSGIVRWVWHEKTQNKAGTASVSCSFNGAKGSAKIKFTINPKV